ncbi:MAG: hypothetical protein AB2731_07935 [Candidatus Thiodiazotropha sp.]
MINFRKDARTALRRAKSELESNENHRLKYAALELRFAMEAITFDRAYAYRKEIPPEEYETWQPRKMIQFLINIDPTTDKNSSLSIGFQEKFGKPAETLTHLGSEEVLNLSVIKCHYNALGSFLHVPTFKQMNECGSHNTAKLRKHCEVLLEKLERVLASTVFNVMLGEFSSIECSRCSKTIRRRMPTGEERTEAKCFECGAEYTLFKEQESKIRWEPKAKYYPCPNASCDRKKLIWMDEVKPGTHWKCDSCSKSFEIALGIQEIQQNDG